MSNYFNRVRDFMQDDLARPDDLTLAERVCERASTFLEALRFCATPACRAMYDLEERPYNVDSSNVSNHVASDGVAALMLLSDIADGTTRDPRETARIFLDSLDG